MALHKSQYITIQAWMGTAGLNLSGNHLLVYAIIYGFSQDGDTPCRCHLSYFCEWTGATDRTIRSVIGDLQKRGYIRRVAVGLGRGALTEYRANMEIVDRAQKGEKFAGFKKAENISKKGENISKKGGKNFHNTLCIYKYNYKDIIFFTREAIAKRKEEFYKLFFFKNAAKPALEVDEFLRVNTISEWRDSKGYKIDTSIDKLLAWADGWQLKQGVGRVNANFLSMWRELYNEAVEHNEPIASQMLDERIHCISGESKVVVFVPDALYHFFESKIAHPCRYRDIMNSFRKGRSWTWNTIEDDKSISK